MGATCEPCCAPDEYKKIEKTEVENKDWQNAVVTSNLVGIKILHHGDPDLINKPVDELNGMAIHYAVKNKKMEILDYLLNNGANVNVQAGPDHNSALHEAAILEDFVAMRKLFHHGINDKLKNNKGKLAITILSKKLRREFNKAKNYSDKDASTALLGVDKEALAKSRQQTSGIMLAGWNLNEKNEQSIKSYLKRTDHAQNFIRRKQEEVNERRGLPKTQQFGEQCGVDVDELALYLNNSNDLSKMWTKLVKRNCNAIKKQMEIYKLLYGLTTQTLKKKNPRAKKPKPNAVKALTVRLCKKLPKNKGKATLTKEEFEKKLHTHLFDIHDEIVDEEETSTA